MTLEFTDAAVSDLQSIRNYTLAKWGERQEQVYLDAMWDRFEEILTEPNRSRAREDLFPGCQLAAQGKHVILFRVQRKTLQIVRILHSHMDYPQHLPPEVAE
ncbi:MAG: type II toxin-antitoxin system RelE/ParE family toxin [Verrucomicrobiia bacterium]|jgi:toxin ParE1/3/4